jgi:transcriptional regulator
MYIPEHFSVEGDELGYRFIDDNPFGLLVCPMGEAVPEMAHIPFVLDREGNVLRAHVARGNPIAHFVRDTAPVVAVFTGAHAYVSPSWYENPAKNVPTWNYAAVHAHGVARRLTAKEDAVRDLAAMTARYEERSRAPWSFAAADTAYVDRLVGGVAAFEITIQRLEVKFKMSQNRPVSDRVRVVAQLRARNAPGDQDVANLVEELNGLQPS